MIYQIAQGNPEGVDSSVPLNLGAGVMLDKEDLDEVYLTSPPQAILNEVMKIRASIDGIQSWIAQLPTRHKGNSQRPHALSRLTINDLHGLFTTAELATVSPKEERPVRDPAGCSVRRGLEEPVHKHQQAFPQFCRLPGELRRKIWRMFAPGGRIFEPFFEHNRPLPHGQFTSLKAHYDVDQNDPYVVKLKERHPPPVVRRVCRESRQACDDIGGFLFGIIRNTRRGFWFNYMEDIVLLDSGTLKHVGQLFLGQVRNVAIFYSQLRYEADCEIFIHIVGKYLDQCRNVLVLCCNDFTVNSIWGIPSRCSLTLHPLGDLDLVYKPDYYSYTFTCTNDGEVAWMDFRHVVLQVWKRLLRHEGFSRVPPQPIGIDAIISKEAFEEHKPPAGLLLA
ncbi:hypothetical protein RJ55_08016 [Drechmeria coniospora]|nr:hypothetical protein RJ55_08016 [Drechmeria coniospora]